MISKNNWVFERTTIGCYIEYFGNIFYKVYYGYSYAIWMHQVAFALPKKKQSYRDSLTTATSGKSKLLQQQVKLQNMVFIITC